MTCACGGPGGQCGGGSADPGGIGERLAGWLEELGLAAHLAEAGLPTFERDEQGAARWTDPRTGRPLDAAQLEQLDQVLHHDGADPQHAVPVGLVQLARQARVRAELLAAPWFTYESLADLRDTSVDAARFWAHKSAGQHRLLVVPVDAGVVVPAFQLSDDGEPRADLLPLLAPLLAAGMDPWRAWAWLTQPVALLAGLVPEQAAADPETAELAVRAADRLAERVTAG